MNCGYVSGSKSATSVSAAAAAAATANSKLRGPVNGDECYFWRTTGCQFTTGCRYRHVPEHKGIDKKPWQKTGKWPKYHIDFLLSCVTQCTSVQDSWSVYHSARKSSTRNIYYIGPLACAYTLYCWQRLHKFAYKINALYFLMQLCT